VVVEEFTTIGQAILRINYLRFLSGWKCLYVINAHVNTLKLISLQNKLLLSIGGTLDASEAILTFMKVAVEQLDLKSIHLYLIGDSSTSVSDLSRFQSLPNVNTDIDDKSLLDHLLQRLDSGVEKPYFSEKLNDGEITVFLFGSLGMLILESNAGMLSEYLKSVVSPVVLKLASYHEICIKQQRLDKESTINKAAQLTYKQQAKRDPLTNLPNRREFHYSLSREISNAQRYDYYGALMYIDLDNFKNVNDSLGHSIGDILLTLVAQRLSDQKRTGDIVFRIGGDEFVYILNNVGSTGSEAMNTSIAVADRIIESLAKPIDINEFSLHVTPSIGIAIFPDEFDDGNDSENVLRHADTAMYRAKKQGKNCYEFFNPEMHVEASKRLIIEDHLRKAIKNDEFNLVYQPIIDINENIIGAETLVRWHSPVLGNVPPDEFIPIAEESNLILDLSHWITKHACSFAQSLCARLDNDSTFSYISINISPRQFIQSDFVESIISIISSYETPREFIKLEFTENVLLDNIDITIDKMEKLQNENIDFLLDDFGTGYSSLSYLHKLPIKIIKIDKSFVDDLFSEQNNTQVIVNAILVMAEELGIKCIIEGVEFDRHVSFFKQKEVYGMQGFYYHKPVSGDDLLKLLSEP
jgi:diguanylate cyclase (GGDEF)-like protein